MIALKEGLLNKKNIKDIAPSYVANYKKSDLKSGDVAVLNDRSYIGIFIKKPEDTFSDISKLFNDDEYGIFAIYTPVNRIWEYISLENYNKYLECDVPTLTVNCVYPKKVSKDLLKDKKGLEKWMLKNYFKL